MRQHTSYLVLIISVVFLLIFLAVLYVCPAEPEQEKQQKIAYELAVALEEAKEVNEAEQSFLSKMSYDIRRPVNVKDILNTLKESKYTITSEPLKGAE